ncbi:succinylglutamate-semialdehyde dehydrogenase [Klebsiella pneumoniae]|nr:succinylglutamic semialdehyde dehydrogenase [Klebsiella pneumoniae]
MAVKAQFIAGQWLPGSGATMSKLAPEDQSLLWQAASAGADDVQAACAAARAAFYPWSHRPLAERIDVVQRFAALLETHKEALATLISRETSKPLWETRTEVQAMIGKAAISIEAYHQRTGFHESTLPDGKALLRHKPHGVMAVFGPYNFPGHLPNGHIIPALIAGNTIVFKPSELTPATAEMTVQLWQQAGIPDGAINLLQGGKATGQALLENRDIDGVLFTGSAAAGFHFHRYFGGQPEKMLALEMGGNNALIVADVADIDAALHVIIQSAFISAGQRCTCARRLIVPRGEQGDALLQRLVEASAQIRAGKWDDQPAPFMGGVISLDAAQNMLAAQQKLEGLGGKVLLRMRQPDPRSTVLTPGIVDVTGIEVPDEEYFGPLLTIIRYDGFPEAIRLANQTRYGLAVGLISSDAALPQHGDLGDEGAANHNRFCREYDRQGVQFFVYGRRASGGIAPVKYPARQTLEASEAVARLHQLDPRYTVFAQQAPQAIDRGVFHNDVIAVSNRHVLFHHQQAFVDQAAVLTTLRAKSDSLDIPFTSVEVPDERVSLDDAVASYLFNSQLLSKPDGKMLIVVPEECRQRENVWRYLSDLAADSASPIDEVAVFDLRESMRNGGGPACLRLRVVLNEAERQAVNAHSLMNDERYQQLTAWVEKHYRDRLHARDLADPQLLREVYQALDELTQILRLGAVYDFQR